jgi:hypothetical protein
MGVWRRMHSPMCTGAFSAFTTHQSCVYYTLTVHTGGRKMTELTRTDSKVVHVDEDSIDETLKWYFMTPESERGNIRTWKDLSAHIGIDPRALIRRLHMRPEIASDILQWTAIQMGHHIPMLSDLLLKAAKAGSIRAIEIYLDHVRKTITDERLIKASKGVHNHLTVNAFIANVESSAAKIMRTAKALEDNSLDPAVTAKLKARVAIQDVLPAPKASGPVADVGVCDPEGRAPTDTDTPPTPRNPSTAFLGGSVGSPSHIDQSKVSESLPSDAADDVLDLT